jgi:putative acetyltransferase
MTIKRTDSNDPDFHSLINELDKDLWNRYEDLQHIYSRYNKVPDLPTVVVAYDNALPAGCGCFKPFDDCSVEIKRMFVTPAKRGSGVAAAILNELHRWAKELGYTDAVLETGTKQHEAIRFYQREGYTIMENYGQYIGMETSICMKKTL